MNEPLLARQDFQRAAEIDDEDTDAWQSLGNVLCDMDLFDTSISACTVFVYEESDNGQISFRRCSPELQKSVRCPKMRYQLLDLPSYEIQDIK